MDIFKKYLSFMHCMILPGLLGMMIGVVSGTEIEEINQILVPYLQSDIEFAKKQQNVYDCEVVFLDFAIDLNDDGKNDYLVSQDGGTYSGVAGSFVTIFVQEEGQLREVFRVIIPMENNEELPVKIHAEKTNGFYDISFYGSEVVWKYDGQEEYYGAAIDKKEALDLLYEYLYADVDYFAGKILFGVNENEILGYLWHHEQFGGNVLFLEEAGNSKDGRYLLFELGERIYDSSGYFTHTRIMNEFIVDGVTGEVMDGRVFDEYGMWEHSAEYEKYISSEKEL